MLTVTKRDGSTQPYDPQKIAAVLIAAGLNTHEAQVIADRVTRRLASHTQSSVTSLHIRDLVISELEKSHPYTAGLYKWYQKTKDASIQV